MSAENVSMPKTRKVQVTLEADVYERLCEIAEREHTSLAGVVRESVVRYCIQPDDRQRRERALDRLTSIQAPVPEHYEDWEAEYSRLKAGEAGDTEATAAGNDG